MARAVLTGWLTGLGFDHAWFILLSSERLCVFCLHVYLDNFFVTFFTLPFNNLCLVGLVLDLVN